MKNQQAESTKVAPFGQRKVRPRVLVSDAKQHIRTFLVEAFEELGCVTCDCAHVGELSAMLDAQPPDLVMLGLSSREIETCEMLNLLAIKDFDGKILLFGPRISPLVAAVHQLGEKQGLAMLPILVTPFGDESLRDSVAT
jgi:CheY-like chemotaxis protein